MHLNTWHRKQNSSSINKLLRSAHWRITQALTMIFTYLTTCSSLSSDVQIKTNATRSSSAKEWLQGLVGRGCHFPNSLARLKGGKGCGCFRVFFFSFFPFVFAQAWVFLCCQDTVGIGGRRLHVGWLWLWLVSKDGHHQFLHSLYMLFYSWGRIYLPSPWT